MSARRKAKNRQLRDTGGVKLRSLALSMRHAVGADTLTTSGLLGVRERPPRASHLILVDRDRGMMYTKGVHGAPYARTISSGRQMPSLRERARPATASEAAFKIAEVDFA